MNTNRNQPNMKKSILVLALSGIVQLASYGQWTNDYLSGARWQMGSTVIGSKVFYAGGDFDDVYSTVDIYDHATGQVVTTNMSVDRRLANAVSSGSKVLIAGGVNGQSETTDVVDVYDTITQAWTVSQLSQARFGMSAVSNGTDVLFAGGAPFPPTSAYDRVDIYQGGSGTWTTAALSVPRVGMGAVFAGNKAFFAGGFSEVGVSDRVDIYDFVAGTWSTATLSQPRWGLAAAVAGTKVLFAGGQNNSIASDRVDIYDLNTSMWSTASLSVARSFAFGECATSVCGKAIFVGGGMIDETTGAFATDYSEIDVYDGTSDDWSVGQLPYDLLLHSTNVLDDQIILVAGGGTITGSNIQLYDEIRIWEDGCGFVVGIDDVTGNTPQFTIFPNPANDQITLVLNAWQRGNYSLIDAAGRTVQQGRLVGERTVLPTARMDRGIYLLRVEANSERVSQRIVLE